SGGPPVGCANGHRTSARHQGAGGDGARRDTALWTSRSGAISESDDRDRNGAGAARAVARAPGHRSARRTCPGGSLGRAHARSRHREVRAPDGERRGSRRPAPRPRGSRLLAARARHAAGIQRVTSIELPAWSQVSDKRREHIARAVALLEQWAAALHLPPDEANRWRTAGTLHDALRDAPEPMLRALSGDATRAAEILHGPAAAVRAEQEGERRA